MPVAHLRGLSILLRGPPCPSNPHRVWPGMRPQAREGVEGPDPTPLQCGRAPTEGLFWGPGLCSWVLQETLTQWVAAQSGLEGRG